MRNTDTIIDDYEIKELLSSIPFNVIKASIEEQIELSTIDVDYVDVIFKKCKVIKKENDGDSLVEDCIDDLIVDFCGFVISKISESLDTTFHVDEDISMKKLEKVTKTLYSIFVLNHTKKAVKYLYTSICTNENLLGEIFIQPKKDASTIANKKKYSSKNISAVISNLYEVINFLVYDGHNEEEFMFYMSQVIEDSDFSYIHELIDSGILSYGYQEAFTSKLIDNKDEIYNKVLIKLNNRFLKKGDN